MQLQQKKIEIGTSQLRAASFLIERFEVPADLSSLVIKLAVPEYPIDVLLVYDSAFNLRAEFRSICNKTRFVISQDEMLTSKGAKHGRIHSGEWIIAIQLDESLIQDIWGCQYTIEGYTDEVLY